MKKRGYFFLIDSFVGTGIILIAILIIYNVHVTASTNPQSYDLANDYVNVFTSVQIRDLTDPYVINLTNRGEINNSANTIVNQIAEFYYREKYEGCTDCLEIGANIIRNISNGVLPKQYGFSYIINETMVYNRSMDRYDKAKLVINTKKFTFFKLNSSSLFGPVITEVAVWQ